MPWGKGERGAELGVQRRVRKRVSCYRRGHKVALGQNPEDCLKEVKDQAAQVGVECEMSRAMIYPSACPQHLANQYMFAESIQLLYLFFIA